MSEKDLAALIDTVNDYWLAQAPEKGNASWESACYFLGCLSACKLRGRQVYADAALAWAENNAFLPYGTPEYAEQVLVEHFTQNGRLPWRYTNSADYRYIHADHILCGQVYLSLASLFPGLNEERMLAGWKEALDFTVADAHDDYWWWIDAIHMGLSTYHCAARRWSDAAYAEKGHRLYLYTKSVCYDKDAHLWYRDWHFLPQNMPKDTQGKVFWARGNGWVYAGLAHALSVVSKDSDYYAEYANTLREMTDALLPLMCPDGFWHSDLLAPSRFDSPETSGTLMILFGLLRGVRLGLLSKENYLPVFERGFEAVTRNAISKEGRVLYVQGVADRPGPVERSNTRAYAVGYMLMLLCEKLLYDREADGGEKQVCSLI